MSRIERGPYNMHHRCCKAQHGTDHWPPNNLVRVEIRRHQLWNTVFNGLERIDSVITKINILMESRGVKLRAVKIL